MLKKIKKLAPILQVLSVAPPKLRKLILSNADDELIYAICEICLNLCKGNIRCDEKSYKALKRYKESLYKLASVKRKPSSLKEAKKELLIEGKGVFLPLLLTPILTAISQWVLEKI